MRKPTTRNQEKLSPGSLVGSRKDWKIYTQELNLGPTEKEIPFYRYWHGFWKFVKIHTEMIWKVILFLQYNESIKN